MSLAISIRFLTGRAHLHPWQTHHSEGRVEWPPSQWRLLRAFVAIAGRGLTTLPVPDFVADPGKKPKPTEKNQNPEWPPDGYASLPDQWHREGVDEIPLSRLAGLLDTLAATPTIWLPKTAGGHTRQYFPIHLGGRVKNTGSAVFDTFATVRKDQPLVFHWPNVDLRRAIAGRSEADPRSNDLLWTGGVVVSGRIAYPGVEGSSGCGHRKSGANPLAIRLHRRRWQTRREGISRLHSRTSVGTFADGVDH